jgi:hypothetical protein
MIITQDILRRDTVQLLRQIDQLITEINRHAAQIGIEGYQLRDSSGGWVMTPLLLAKTQAYATLVQLQSPR